MRIAFRPPADARRRAALSLTLAALAASCGGSAPATPCGAALCLNDAAARGDDASAADLVSNDVAAPDVALAQPDVTADAAPVMAPAALVVSPAWLADALAQGRAVQVVDVRAEAAWRAGHIPGARSFDANVLSATVDGVSNEVLGRDAVATQLGAAGLRSDVTTVVYGDSTTTAPARLVWTMHHYGQDDVHLLDGGFAAWRAAGRAAETAAATVAPATWASAEGRDLVDGATVLARRAEPGVYVLDVRTAAEYAAGHIPGARNVDWNVMVSNGSLVAESDLRALYADIPREATVFVYCQSGVRASVSWVVLRHLGYADARLYDGSWSEWSARGYPREP